jgi:hypothetical protein
VQGNSGNTAHIRIRDGIDYITIKDFYLYSNGTEENGIQIGLSGSVNAISNITIEGVHANEFEDNAIYVGSDLVSGVRQITYITLENCWFQNGQQGFKANANSFVGTEDLVVKNTRFSQDTFPSPGLSGANLVEMHRLKDVLVEYCWFDGSNDQALLSIKEPYDNEDYIIRYTKFTRSGSGPDPWGAAVFSLNSWADQYFPEDVYFYCNYIDGTNKGAHITIKRGAQNIHVWSNVLIASPHPLVDETRRVSSGIRVSTDGGRGSNDDIYIYNNTVMNMMNRSAESYDNSTATLKYLWTGITSYDGGVENLNVKNNISYNSRASRATNRRFNYYQSTPNVGPVSWEHNNSYSPGAEQTYYFHGSHRTLAQVQALGYEDDAPAGDNNDPGLNNDGTRTGSNVNSGADLSALAGSLTIQGTVYNMYYDTALHPSTDWTGMPTAAKIVTADQDDHGAGWERGAYVYVE